MTADELIETLNLQPLPIEGGFFAETFRSTETLPAEALPEKYDEDKCAITSIYYLLKPGIFSAFHRLRSDEIYHFYLGDPIQLSTIDNFGTLRTVVLGRNVAAGEHLQYGVPAGVWQASKLIDGGAYGLVGCTVAPGFDPDDYEHGDWESLLRAFPAHHALIMQLTRA